MHNYIMEVLSLNTYPTVLCYIHNTLVGSVLLLCAHLYHFSLWYYTYFSEETSQMLVRLAQGEFQKGHRIRFSLPSDSDSAIVSHLVTHQYSTYTQTRGPNAHNHIHEHTSMHAAHVYIHIFTLHSLAHKHACSTRVHAHIYST